MSSEELILPGDPLPQLSPLLNPPPETTDTKPRTLRLGPGLTLSPFTPSTPILPYHAGTLHLTSSKKPTASITSTPRHYHPAANDPVLVTLLRTNPEQFIVQLTPYTPPAIIPFTSYIVNNAGTTAAVRKSRPNLLHGATIYARVATVHKHLEAVELTVPGPPFGEVVSAKPKSKDSTVAVQKTDYILTISQPLTKILLAEDTLGKPLLSAVASRVPFEMIVGKNGRVWIDAESQRDVIRVVRCFGAFEEGEMWNDEDGGERRIREVVEKIRR